MLKTDNIKIVNPNLESFRNLLIEEQPDYIGTRLHGGIFAMQNFCRTIIISIDNRAKDMDITYNLKCIDRNKIKKELCERINSEIITDIHLDEERIMSWKKQFLSWSEYNEERL